MLQSGSCEVLLENLTIEFTKKVTFLKSVHYGLYNKA